MIFMRTMKDKIYRNRKYFGYAIALLNLILVLLYIFFTFRWYFHSDAATKVLLASEIIKKGTIIPHDWYYVNGDVWFFFIHMPLVLIGKILGFGWNSYILNSLVFVSIYLAAIIYFIKQFKVDFISKILLFVLAISAYSSVNAMMVFGELAGISEPIFIFAMLGIFLSLEKSNKKRYYWLMGLLIFVYVVGAPSRSFIYNVFPALMVTFLLYLDTRSKRYLYLLGTIIVTFAAALAVYYLVFIPNVLMEYSRNNLSFASYDEVLMNIDLFAKGLFFYFSLEGPRNVKVESLNGALYFFNFLLVLFMIISVFKMSHNKSKNIDIVNILSFLLVYFIVVLTYLYIFTNPLAKDATTFRYFRPLFYIVMIFTVLHINKFEKVLRNLTISFILIFLTIENYQIYTNSASPKQLMQARNNHESVANYIVEHNLTYGFASYWNAGLTMALAKNKAIVAPIYMHNFEPRRWLSSESWFHNLKAKKTFLLLTSGEYNNLKSSLKKFINKDPIEKVEVGNFVVLIYDTSNAALMKWQKSKD